MLGLLVLSVNVMVPLAAVLPLNKTEPVLVPVVPSVNAFAPVKVAVPPWIESVPISIELKPLVIEPLLSAPVPVMAVVTASLVSTRAAS